MSSIRISQSAMRKLQRNLLSSWADATVLEAKNLAPVKTGELRDGISVEMIKTSNKKATATVVSKADHSTYVEMGTRHMAAQPFLRPAARKASKKMRIK